MARSTQPLFFPIGTPLTTPFDDRTFAALHDAAREAGDLALAYFRPGLHTNAAVEMKAGNSPVTEADKAANALLAMRLLALLPDAAWLSEETADTPVRLAHRRVLVVDPIDGTRAFIAGDPRWTVSVALVENGRPVMGVVHAPALGETYGAAAGRGAWLNNIRIASSSRTNLASGRVAGPKPMADRLAAKGHVFEMAEKIPSLAYRIANVADGRLDVALAAADAHEWDIAAADLIVQEAGAALLDEEGRILRYNKPDLKQGPLIAAPLALLALLAGPQFASRALHA